MSKLDQTILSIQSFFSSSKSSRKHSVVEINLIPDVKLELLKAKIQRAKIIAVSVILSASVIGVVFFMGMTAYVVQAVLLSSADKNIASEFEKYKNYPNSKQIITLQKQLSMIDATHQEKSITSRMFMVLTSFFPSNNTHGAKINQMAYDKETGTVVIEGQAVMGYAELERLEKTILATDIEYTDSDDPEVEPIKEKLADSLEYVEPASYGENAIGQKVLLFKLSFRVADKLFANIKNGIKIVSPAREDVTDSTVIIPNNLFAPKAKKEQASNQSLDDDEEQLDQENPNSNSSLQVIRREDEN